MNVAKSDDYLKEKFFIYEPAFFHLVLLKLQLFLQYEDSFLFLSAGSFQALKLLVTSYLDQLPQNEYDARETVELSELLFDVGSKIYRKETTENGFFDIELIRSSLLSNLEDSFLLYTGNFWKAYFDYRFVNSEEESTKLRITEICEDCVFFNFFLSKNMDYTCKLIENYVPAKSVNMKLIAKSVVSRIGKVLYKANTMNKSKKSVSKIEKNRNKKITKIILLCFKKNFLRKEEIVDLFVLNKETSEEIIKGIIKQCLLEKNIDQENRLLLWLRFSNLHKNDYFRIKQIPVSTLSESQTEQIHIDMVRTKQWRGEAYQAELEALAIDFLGRYEQDLEYFQGFNYILAFFYDYANDKKSLFSILHFISNYIIRAG